MGKSALMANFAENAALHAGGKAVALFSLEMSESELAQRFIASQASIKGDDLRKGRVPGSRWGKIMEASNRLAKSPLFIDDSSDLSVLDVRAKARRLLQQHAGRPRADPHRLPAAHARRRADGQPRRADRADLARAQDAGARARVPR